MADVGEFETTDEPKLSEENGILGFTNVNTCVIVGHPATGDYQPLRAACNG
jgi:hypothetical protein